MKAHKHLLRELLQSCLIECRRRSPFNFVAKRVRIIVHPAKQRGSRLARAGSGGLPGLDPAADYILRELPEAAARIINFVGLRMAPCKKGLKQIDGAHRIGRDQLIDGSGDLFEQTYERGTFTVANECSGPERSFNLPLNRVCLAAWLVFHWR